jgi:HlyD family secretion protein
MNPGRKLWKWLWLAAAILLVAFARPVAIWILGPKPASQVSAAANKTEPVQAGPRAVACLGRIEPENGVIRIAAPYLFGRPSLVKELRVKEGDRVRAGQLLAILDGKDQLKAAMDQCRARVAVAHSRLAQVKAGAKSADLSAQRAEIARLEASLENEQAEYKRYAQLRKTDDVTVSDLNARQTAVVSRQRLLEEAQAKLKSMSEVRPADVELAEAELRAARADEEKARREHESSLVYAPVTAQVIKINAHAGESADAQGLLELARTDHMYAVAEVYETDIGRVRLGQQATISSDLLPHPLEGRVAHIGMKVTPSSVLPGDPASYADSRVIEVKIRLDESRSVAGLINGKVSVVIHP